MPHFVQLRLDLRHPLELDLELLHEAGRGSSPRSWSRSIDLVELRPRHIPAVQRRPPQPGRLWNPHAAACEAVLMAHLIVRDGRACRQYAACAPRLARLSGVRYLPVFLFWLLAPFGHPERAVSLGEVDAAAETIVRWQYGEPPYF